MVLLHSHSYLFDTFTDSEQGAVESYDALSTPIKVFVAEFVRRNVIGVASQSMGYLLCELFTHLGLDITKEIELKDFGANSKVPVLSHPKLLPSVMMKYLQL